MSDLQQQILNTARSAISESIKSELVGYGKPLSKITEAVIDSHKDELFMVLDKEVSQLIGGDGFRGLIKTELNKSLAKILIQKMGGELEKQVNTLKQNPQTRAKITLAINDIIESI